jgi:hypothetical protein
MFDPFGPIERIQPTPPPPKPRRERSSSEESEQHRHRREQDDQDFVDEEPDDGLPHIDVQA